MYLGEKSGKFYPQKDKHLINQWLMGQMAYVGPMLGQHHQFHHYNPGKSNWGEDRYFKIAKTIYKDLDERLEKSKFLAGDYSIADIATFPWIARHEWHDIGLKKFKNLSRWYKEISEREAVIKGFDLLKEMKKYQNLIIKKFFLLFRVFLELLCLALLLVLRLIFSSLLVHQFLRNNNHKYHL